MDGHDTTSLGGERSLGEDRASRTRAEARAVPPLVWSAPDRADTAATRARELERRLTTRAARIAVVGLGSVGLPLVEAFVEAGFACVGLDVDADKVARLTRGESPLHHVAGERVAALQASGRFRPTLDPVALADVDVAVICVPTPLGADREPDLAHVRAATETLARHLRPGTLVVLESTTFPGTTRGVVAPILAARGLEPGRDVWLAFSPEREDPGRGVATRSIPKVVGGTCTTSTRLAEVLYRAAIERVHVVASAEVAEAAKLLENVFRAVNIALVNELKVAFDALGIDVWDVVDAAATKPFGFMKFTPGPGLGGHCLPIDPFYLSWIARRHGVETRLVELAGEISRAMPAHVVERTCAALAERGRPVAGARVLVLGLAYKPDVDIVTESPSMRLLELLEERGVACDYADPHVPLAPGSRERRSVALDARVVASYDAVLVATDHRAFDWDLVAAHARLVVDTRNALASRLAGRAHYVKA